MYRYSLQEYNSLLITLGIIRIGTLYDFRRMEHRQGVVDTQEGQKNISHHIDYLHVADPNNLDIKSNINMQALEKLGGIKVTGKNNTFVNIETTKNFNVNDCFIFCTSMTCSRETMQQFEGADSCIEIVNVDLFHNILTDTLNRIYPVVFQSIYKIIYQDREEPWNGRDWGNYPALIKEPKFEKQNEFRAIWKPIGNQPISPIITGNYRLGTCCRHVSI
jgi:hypothetical protein